MKMWLSMTLVLGLGLVSLGCYKIDGDGRGDGDGGDDEKDTSTYAEAGCLNAGAAKCEEEFEECTEACKLNPLGCHDACYDNHCACLKDAGCDLSKIEACADYIG